MVSVIATQHICGSQLACHSPGPVQKLDHSKSLLPDLAHANLAHVKSGDRTLLIRHRRIDRRRTEMCPLEARGQNGIEPFALPIANGSTNAAKVAAFRAHRRFYGPRLAGHVMPRHRSVDVDEQADYDLACWYGERSTAQGWKG